MQEMIQFSTPMENTMDLSLLLIQDLAVLLLAAGLAGWICDRIGISKIVGYLIAGIVIGTPQITWVYVTDAVRIHTLSQLGLVFLMFFIGLGFRIRRMRDLGFGVLAATVVTALLTLTLTRIVTALLGFGEIESLFFAGMLMISSSAIIGKELNDLGLAHERSGQLAMGVTLLEDLVAILLLAWLGSLTITGEGGSLKDALITIAMLSAFVLLLIVPGLLLIPSLIKRVYRSGSSELETLLIAGLMFAMAWLTVKTGFSLALGAFLCGVIVAESSRLRSILANFSGLKDVFVTVFFTSVGMAIDITILPQALGLIALGVILAFAARIIASATGLLLAAESDSTALKAAFCLTPIGEFSFVIAGMGIAAGLVPETFQVAAVGISLLTSLLSPTLMRHADRVAGVLSPSKIRPVGLLLHGYRNLWSSLATHSQRNKLIRILTPRFWQIARELILITAVLIFSKPGYQWANEWVLSHHADKLTYVPLYWALVALVCLAPGVALFRNVSAISMIVGESLGSSLPRDHPMRKAITFVLKTFAYIVFSAWFFNLLPIRLIHPVMLAVLALIAILGIWLGWRRLIRWHSHAEIKLKGVMQEQDDPNSRVIQQAKQHWGLNLQECVLPDETPFAGKTLEDLSLRSKTGVMVIGMERQGFAITSIGRNTHLFPGDKLFIVGEPKNLKAAKAWIGSIQDEPIEDERLSTSVLEEVTVHPNAPCIGKTLGELAWPSSVGVQVAAVLRGEARILSPNREWTLAGNDTLLLVGRRQAIDHLKSQLASLILD
jgi:monovalent cation:H+ antiporter-2, CPA2 family